MQYREKILELMFDENDEEAFEKWLVLQSPLDQVDILKELKEIVKEINDEEGDEEGRQLIDTLDQKAEEYQEAYLDEKLAELNYEIAVAERDKAFAEADRRVEGVKAYARECIETNAPNADKMREAMVHVIAYEKAGGTYDPATWTWLKNRDHPAANTSGVVYYDEVLDFFEDFDHVKFMTWLEQQPPLEQVEIVRQFKDVLEQVNTTLGNNSDLREVLDELRTWADSYQKACLDEKKAGLNLEIALENRDKAFAEMDNSVEGVKAYARECIETNAPNAAQMRELTVHIINYEKGNNTYDPATWTWLTNG